MDLTAIKVKIGISSKGYAQYPEFNKINSSIRNNLDWSSYIDAYGSGWHYDKQSGHKEDTDDSPFGQQWGVILVPEDFAKEAIKLFPAEVSEIIESEVETFYNTKAHLHEPDEDINKDIIDQIKIKQDLELTLTIDQLKALDPDDPTPGIVKNKKKLWVNYKAITNIKIIAIKEEAK